MREKTAAAACQVMQTAKRLKMERSIEAARVAQLRIIEKQARKAVEAAHDLKNEILKAAI